MSNDSSASSIKVDPAPTILHRLDMLELHLKEFHGNFEDIEASLDQRLGNIEDIIGIVPLSPGETTHITDES